MVNLCLEVEIGLEIRVELTRRVGTCEIWRYIKILVDYDLLCTSRWFHTDQSCVVIKKLKVWISTVL